ncbi:MAG TPA: hypothetical protein HPP76_01120 [Desulfuromonadales bacterium]|nr:hypothetical protein [Desulfuromonadales bacterium]
MSVLELIKGKKDDNSGLLGVIEEALRAENWNFHRDADAPVLRTGANGKNSDFKAVFVVREEHDSLFFYVEIAPKVPDGRRKEAADFLTRANFGIGIGNFEMDMENGEVRYKISIDMEGGVLSHAMVNNIIRTGFSTTDRYFPAFMSVCFGNAIPSVAIREAET